MVGMMNDALQRFPGRRQIKYKSGGTKCHEITENSDK